MPLTLRFIIGSIIFFQLLAAWPGATWADDGTATPTATAVALPGPPPTASVLPENLAGEKLYTFDTVFGSKGSGADQLDDPEGICVGPGDNLYIADTNNNRIQVWTSDGKPVKSIGSFGISAMWRNDPQFDHPAGVLAIPDGQVYVADTNNNRIVLLDPNGLVALSWGSQGARHRQFNLPRVVAQDHFGNIWVLDTGNSRVENFTNDGKFNFVWGSLGSQEGHLNFPQGMALNQIDQCVISDSGNFHMEIFNDRTPANVDFSPVTTASGDVTMEPTPVTTAPVTVEGWYGDGPCQFKEPAGAAVTKTGLVIVADGVTGRLEIFNKSPFEFYGEWRATDEKLNLPFPPHFRGVACDSQNRLYITDIQNDCVIRLKLAEADEPFIQINVTPVPTEAPSPTFTPTPDDSIPFEGQGFPIR